MNMRTKIFILALVASMAFISCEEYIPVDLPGPEKMLLVNALMSTGDTTHTVCVGVSTHEKAEKLKSGHLECWVNGELVATSDNVEKADGLLYHNVFKFRADFKAGDEVRVVVESEGMRAERRQWPWMRLSLPEWTRLIFIRSLPKAVTTSRLLEWEFT